MASEASEVSRQPTEWDNFLQKGWTKCKQQPLVPLGALFTTFALLGAVREFKRGNSQNVNRYLRFRVVAQGATVAAMLVGSFVYERAMEEQREQEKAAERERMFNILDSVGRSDTPDTAPKEASEPPPAAAQVATPTPSAPPPQVEEVHTKTTQSSSGPVPEKKTKGQTRYVGNNDQWREYFNRKQSEAAASQNASGNKPVSQPLAAEPAVDPSNSENKPPSSGRGWLPWSK